MNKKIRVAITDDREAIRCQILIKEIEYCGAEPVLLSRHCRGDLNEHINRVFSILDTCNALIFPGNVLDVPPRAYGIDCIHPETALRMPENPSDVRFEVERAVGLKVLAEKRLPVFAVCGGMHLFNVIMGGTLVQHLPDDRRIQDGQLEHRDSRLLTLNYNFKKAWIDNLEKYFDHGKPENIYQSTHNIAVVPESFLGKLYKRHHPNIDLTCIGELSMHHQGIFKENLAKDLKPVAFAPDGLIEAAEHRFYPKMFVLMQYHNECDVSKLAIPMMQSLLEQAKG